MNTVLFSEKQKFNQWWVWLIILGCTGYAIFDAVKYIHRLDMVGGIIVPLGIVFLVIVLMASIRLDIRIDEAGIYYRFFPLQIKERTVNWADLKAAYVRKYSPLGEYGGWGWRYSWRGSGKALNIAGSMGLQLEFNNGKKLLLGTQKADELAQVLQNLPVNHSLRQQPNEIETKR